MKKVTYYLLFLIILFIIHPLSYGMVQNSSIVSTKNSFIISKISANVHKHKRYKSKRMYRHYQRILAEKRYKKYLLHTLKSLHKTRHHLKYYKFNHRKANHESKIKFKCKTSHYRNIKKYTPYVTKVCSYYHISKYIPLMLGIMQTETNGKNHDLMQSSESAGLYPNTLGKRDSVIQAARFMQSILGKATHGQRNNPSVLAQTYNFGKSFLRYAQKHHGYHIKMSKAFSKRLAKSAFLAKNKKKYRNKKRKKIPMYYYHGKYLYKNGGNYYYGKIIKNIVRYRK